MNWTVLSITIMNVEGINRINIHTRADQEKSSPAVSSAIMLLGAAYRPIYVSFLPGPWDAFHTRFKLKVGQWSTL